MSNAYWDLIDRMGQRFMPRELAEWQALEYPNECAGWLLRAGDGPRQPGKKTTDRVRKTIQAPMTRTEGPV